MSGMRERFLERGFQDFIAKPLDRKELGQLLAQWVPEDRREAGSKEKKDAPLNLEAFRIKGIDIDAASRYYVGDEEGFAELLELYYIDGQRKKELLRELEGSDPARYQVEVHGLKSASANIGAMEVSNLARAQESAASRGDTEFIARQFPVLMSAYEELLENIGAFLERRRQAAPREEKLPPLPAGELRGRVEEALRELEDFRSQECAGIVEELLRRAMPRDTEKSLGEIQRQLKLYEDDCAEELLGQLLHKLEKESGDK